MERMTWNQIRIKYPDQWVGLMDVEFEEDNNSAIKTAIVKYSDKPRSELDILAFTEDIVSIYITPDNIFQLGFLGGISK